MEYIDVYGIHGSIGDPRPGLVLGALAAHLEQRGCGALAAERAAVPRLGDDG